MAPDLRSLRIAVAALLALVGVASASFAAPDWELVELRRQLTELSDELRQSEISRARQVNKLVEDVDWPIPPARQTSNQIISAEGAPPAFGWTDLRIALAPMRQIYGGENDKQVLLARNGNFEALEVRSGVLTLSDLRDQLTNRHLSYLATENSDLLRVPLVIAPDATLRLLPGDRLILDRAKGAFIINFGKLEFVDATVTTTEIANPYIDRFVPFISSVGSGSVHLKNSRLIDLGFGNTAKYSGFSVMAYPTMRPEGRVIIEGSQFDRLVTVSLIGTAAPELRANRFYSMRRNSLLVSRSSHVLLAGNLFAGESPTNAIRVTNGSVGAKLLGNVILEGSRAGFLVASGSDGTVVRNNLIWRRNGGGVKLLNSSCAVVEGNLILDDKQKGVEVRESQNAHILGNDIIGNRNAGIWVSSQPETEMTFVTDNILQENGSGVSSASGGEIAMNGNDLSNQFPRFLDGDLTHQFRAIIDDMRGQNPIVISGADVKPADLLAPRDCIL